MVQFQLPKSIINDLSDDDLIRINKAFPWDCFTLDELGRSLGKAHSVSKRNKPQIIPDERITAFHQHYSLSDKSVLEIGCFEGVHTIALARTGAVVEACDGRIENVLKTVLRCYLYGCQPRVFPLDVDNVSEVLQLKNYDFIHHVGVLYHLKNPVQSLAATLSKCRTSMLLDTHVSSPNSAMGVLKIDGREFPVERYREGGIADPFSGLSESSLWISKDAIGYIAEKCGFRTAMHQERQERNGLRVLMHLERVKQ
jgi:hypothetical protein